MDLPRWAVAKISIEPATGHWLWQGYRNPDGYGMTTVKGRRVSLHRYVYEQLVGPIPEGMVIDHICRVRECVAPEHLRVVTPAQNALENSVGFCARRAASDHCERGHPYGERNLIITKTGQRLCRACRNAYMREYMRARSAAQPYKSPYWAPREEVAALNGKAG